MPMPKGARIESTRTQFRALLAANPNYFGTAPDSVGDFPVIVEQSFETSYEELTCVSYSPKLDRLEATFIVKRPYGYSGDLCTNGSNEYVRFYVDYGAGWQDVGPASVNVHDIPVGEDWVRLVEAESDWALLDRAMNRVRRRVQPKTWEAFRLLALEGRSGAEVAEQLGMTIGTVFMARSNVQKLMKEEVRRLSPPEGPPDGTA